MKWIQAFNRYLSKFSLYRMTMDIGDVIEIIIIAVLLYYILAWTKKTKAWALIKGMFVILAFLAIAYFAHMDTILWMAQNVLSFAVIALIIMLQPELRKALEELGTKKIWRKFFLFEIGNRGEVTTVKTIKEIVQACMEMARVRTGALIVIEQQFSMLEYEQTGIEIDGIVSSQLLINIFEKNTPLHDGAVLIRGNRIVSATCYLPLSVNLSISKDLGTRHRAGVGISEVTDSITVIVSEETGRISLAYKSELFRNLDAEQLCAKLEELLIEEESEENKSKLLKKGRSKAKK